MNLSKRSTQDLLNLVEEVTKQVAELEKKEPSYKMALKKGGIRDESYVAEPWGIVPSYSGEIRLKTSNGNWWKAIGHPSEGNDDHIKKAGFIEFVPMF